MAEPTSQMLKPAKCLLSLSKPVTTNAIVPFFDKKSLSAFTRTCRRYRDEYTDKITAAEMLHCVLNPTLVNQKRFLELLSIPKRDKDGQPLYLIRNDGEEVYFNKVGDRKIKTIRYNTNVLEAILRTKNFHLAKTLFSCIPEHEKTEGLKRYISLTKSQNIWGMPELQITYKNFLDHSEALLNARKYGELDRGAGRIGQALKEHLPWFSMYLFCQFGLHSKANYSLAPQWICMLSDGMALDFDYYGADSHFALYKGTKGCVIHGGPPGWRWLWNPIGSNGVDLDSQSFVSQSRVLSSELDKTIKLYDLDEPLDPSKGLLSLPKPVTTGAIVPFFDMKSLSAFTRTCRRYRDDYTDKITAAEMLHCVLNPTEVNQKRFLELLSIPKRDKDGQPLYLIRNRGEEVYFNRAGVRKTKTFRYDTNVLEAILRTKNFHLAKTLFNCIPEHEKTENLKRYISVTKSQEIWGMPELQIAYKNFPASWQALPEVELDRLIGRIGQAIKEHLPWFSIYLFCHPGYHSDADYTKAPNWTCILLDKKLLDLDLFGPGSTNALYKGTVEGVWWQARMPQAYFIDSQFFISQGKVLSSELDKTIKQFNLDEPKPDSLQLSRLS